MKVLTDKLLLGIFTKCIGHCLYFELLIVYICLCVHICIVQYFTIFLFFTDQYVFPVQKVFHRHNALSWWSKLSFLVYVGAGWGEVWFNGLKSCRLFFFILILEVLKYFQKFWPKGLYLMSVRNKSCKRTLSFKNTIFTYFPY